MLSIFTTSFFAVMRVFLVCAAGAWLVRRGLMQPEFRRTFSRVIVLVMLPCLLLSKVSTSVDPQNLVRWIALPLTSYVYVILGVLVGHGVVLLTRPPPELRRAVIAVTAFHNAGYVPIPLVMALAASPLFADTPHAADLGIAYISVYLVGYSPCLWGLGYPYLANEPLRSLRMRQVLSPPVLSVLGGIALAVLPPCRTLFVEPDAPLRVVLDAAGLAGAGAVPCALLLLGANMAAGASVRDGLSRRTIAGVCCGRLVVMPIFGCLITLGLRRLSIIPAEPMFALVLMLAAATPAATNLMVMCQVHHTGEGAMSKLLFWNYIIAVPTLTLFVALFLWLLGNS